MNEYDEGWVEPVATFEEDLRKATLKARMEMDAAIFKPRAPLNDTKTYNYFLQAPTIRMRPVQGKHPRLRRAAVVVANGFEAVDNGLSWLANKMDDARDWTLDRTETWGDHRVYDGMMPAGSVQHVPFETSIANYPEMTNDRT